ncbi:MAG: glycosyltransferase family 2 protein [Candidatus Heimdallarchaeota archaeon]
MPNVLVIIPLFNEAQLLWHALERLLWEKLPSGFELDCLIVDDGSTDNSRDIYLSHPAVDAGKIAILQHYSQMGYGQTLIDGFKYALESDRQYDLVTTYDADLQHCPTTIANMLGTVKENPFIDVLSGSRYLSASMMGDTSAVLFDRYLVNMLITQLLNSITNLNLTDSFCGLKTYTRPTIERIQLEDAGYAMPLEFWMKAHHLGFTVKEVPTPLVYLADRRPRKNWKGRLQEYMDIILRFCARGDEQQRFIECAHDYNLDLIDQAMRGELSFPVTPYQNFGENLTQALQDALHVLPDASPA